MRALAYTSWERGVFGIANLREDFGLSAFDYYEAGLPENGFLTSSPHDGEPEIFTMATIETPPGLPWSIRRLMNVGEDVAAQRLIGEDGLRLFDEAGETIGVVRPELAQWLVKKAKIAVLEE